MSESLRAERRFPLPFQIFILLMCVSCVFISSRAQGENVANKLESSRQQAKREHCGHYEIIVPYLLSGEQWKPIGSIYSKDFDIEVNMLYTVFPESKMKTLLKRHLNKSEELEYLETAEMDSGVFLHLTVLTMPRMSETKEWARRVGGEEKIKQDEM